MSRVMKTLGGLALVLGALVASAVLLAYLHRPEPATPLSRAAAAGDSREVKALLDAGAPPESSGEGWSALMWAARSGQAESVKELAEAGADPDRRDAGPNGWTPLLHAVHKEHPAAVQALIAAGAEVDRPAPNGLTPLMLAAAQGEADVVEILLDAGADPHLAQGGMTALHHAILSDDPRTVTLLLNRAPDLRLGDGWRDRAVRAYARLRGHSALVAHLDTFRRGVK